MCDLCSEDLEVRMVERDRLYALADRLQRASKGLGYLASGQFGVHPHTADANALGARLAKLGTDLIKEWG